LELHLTKTYFGLWVSSFRSRLGGGGGGGLFELALPMFLLPLGITEGSSDPYMVPF